MKILGPGSPPHDISTIAHTNNFTVSWNPPKYPNGNITVRINKHVTLYTFFKSFKRFIKNKLNKNLGFLLQNHLLLYEYEASGDFAKEISKVDGLINKIWIR